MKMQMFMQIIKNHISPLSFEHRKVQHLCTKAGIILMSYEDVVSLNDKCIFHTTYQNITEFLFQLNRKVQHI